VSAVTRSIAGLKRQWKADGMSEADIHAIIPDRPRPKKADPVSRRGRNRPSDRARSLARDARGRWRESRSRRKSTTPASASAALATAAVASIDQHEPLGNFRVVGRGSGGRARDELVVRHPVLGAERSKTRVARLLIEEAVFGDDIDFAANPAREMW